MKQIIAHSNIKFLFTLPTLALGLLGQTTLVQAQYSNPPTWSPMTMLNVSFDTATLRLDVVDEATKLGAGVYPVLALASLGTYDPAQPWGVLNGTGYSRRLGWNPASSTLLEQVQTTYGSGASIWIESLTRSPGLESYLAIGKYGVNANGTTTVDPAINAYSGIFGTAGSSTRWRWDGLMDHNTYAVSLSDITSPNQLFSATYRVYVGDSLGTEILNPGGSSASTTETWTWQGLAAIPEPTTFSLAAIGTACLLLFRRIKS
ncbi:MAG: hypothetical protein WCT12_17860 [Verrucomicrobiota bacterium]